MIPTELRRLRQWVVWRQERRASKPTKVPYCAKTGHRASVADRSTWTSFAEALAAASRYDGKGFVLTPDDPYVGLDLDDCRDPETGTIEPWAQEIIDLLDSYTEISPSKRGIRIFARGTLPPGGRKRGSIELYDRSRFLTVTEDHLPGTPLVIHDRADQLAALHLRIFRDRSAGLTTPPVPPEPVDLPDSELLDRARQAKNGERFTRLWEGATTGYPSRSEGDLALCAHLAFWTGRDPVRMDRLFRQSRLFRPKWDEIHSADGRTYGQMTIMTAIASCPEVYRVPASAEGRPGQDSFPSPKEEDRKETNFHPRMASEIMAQPPPEIEWLWERYLPMGILALLAAFMKVGKSTFIYALALAIAQGRRFLGFETQKAGVLILAVEEHARDWHLRLLRFGLRPDDPIHVHSGALRASPDTLEAIRHYVLQHGIKLIILDTVSYYWLQVIKDENDNAEVMRAVEPFHALARDTGAIVLLVHHERKAGGEEGRGIRGASALFGIVDQALLLERKTILSRTQRLLRTFGRYSESPHELVIDFQHDEFVSCGPPQEADADLLVTRVLAVLSDEPQDRDRLVAKSGLNLKQLLRVVEDPRHGVIREGDGKKGSPYTYRRAPGDSIPSFPSSLGQERIGQSSEREADAPGRGEAGETQDPVDGKST